MKRRTTEKGASKRRSKKQQQMKVMSSSPSIMTYFTPQKQQQQRQQSMDTSTNMIDLTQDSSSSSYSSSSSRRDSGRNVVKMEDGNDTTMTDVTTTTTIINNDNTMEVDLTQDTSSSSEEEEEEMGLGLMALTELEQRELSPAVFQNNIQSAPLDQIIPICENNVIGRMAAKQVENKVPLPIPREMDGISRHQLTCLSIQQQQPYPTIVWQCHPKAINPIRVYKFRFCPSKNCMIRKSHIIPPKFKIECKVGDVIELDTYLHQRTIHDALLPHKQPSSSQATKHTQLPRQLYRILPLPHHQKQSQSNNILQITPKTPQWTISKKQQQQQQQQQQYTDDFMIRSRKSKHIDSTSTNTSTRTPPAELSRLKLSPILNQVVKTPTPIVEDTVTNHNNHNDTVVSTNTGMVTDESCSLDSMASSSSSSSSPVVLPPLPSVQDRCRAKFEIEDHYTSLRTQQQPEGWYFGTVTHIIEEEKQVKVLFDDETEETFDWPCCLDTFEVILPSVEDKNVFVGITSKQIALEIDPSQLFLGDWVDIITSMNHPQPRRARVAAVHFNTTITDTTKSIPTHIDVYYDIQEKYECQIPLGKGFIHLVERGTNIHPHHWLIGLSVQLPSSTQKKTTTKTTRKRRVYIHSLVSRQQQEQPEQQLMCIVSSTKRKKTKRQEQAEEMIPYNTIVKRLFQTAKEECQTKNTYITWSQEEEDQDNDPMEQQPTLDKVVLQIHPSLGNSLYRSMNSAEPHVGFAMFMQLVNRHHPILPNKECTKRFMDTLLHGPSFNGQTFRDANRTNLTSIYIQQLLSNTNHHHHSNNNNNNSNTTTAINTLRQLTYEQIQDIISLPMTQTRPTTTNNSKSTKSLSAGLQMSSCALQFLKSLLLQEVQHLHNKSSTISFLCIEQQQEPRTILKYVSQATIQCWLRHGSWVIDTVGGKESKQKGRKKAASQSNENDNTFMDGRVSFYANRCLQHLGSILQSFIQFFCATSNNEEEEYDLLDPQSCCDLIYEVVSRTIYKWQENNFDEEYIKRMTIRFLLTCFQSKEPSHINSSSPISIYQLGKIFHVSTELNLILGDDDDDLSI